LGVERPGEEPSLEERDPIALFVGTLYGYKDAIVAVRAFGRAKPNLPREARLVVVGRDPDQQTSRLRLAAASSGVGDSVDVTGPVSQETLEDLYARASVFIMPSRCEGFGLPVLEAMSRGVPVVVANSTSLPEVVAGAGILIESGNVEAFADAIVEVLTNSLKHRSMAERGLARARQLSWDASAERLRDVLVKVASGVG
jgi:glycosyltransferase involved in cell wall biosynthesis